MKKNILLLSYYSAYGPQDTLDEYFSQNNKYKVSRINIPLPELPFIKSIEYIQNKKKNLYPTLLKPILISYFFHPFQVLLLLLTNKKKYHIIIAQSALLVYVANALKLINRCSIIIYYSHGFDPKRFPNKLTGSFYKMLDYYGVKMADYNWVLGQDMVSQREKLGVANDKIFWAPIALPLKRIKKTDNFPKNTLFFLGTLNEMNGVLFLPKIIAHLKRNIPNIHLDLLGDGPLFQKLKNDIKKLHLEKNITLFGLTRFNDYASTMTKHVLGIAPYPPSNHTILQITDPMKLRLYSAAGLPIITTKGFPFSREIEQQGIGLCSRFTVKDFSDTISSMLKDTKMQHWMRFRARKYATQFDQKRIFDKVTKNII